MAELRLIPVSAFRATPIQQQKNALGSGHPGSLVEISGSATAYEGSIMYAVIRTGGKQYRVAPGDVLKIEKVAHENGAVEFGEVLAVSGDAGSFEQSLEGAKVTGTVVGEGRGEKILVFKFKRKKQYKRMQGHRQSFTEVKINEVLVGGKSFKA
ncbi:50S ribosomal protein L21 [Granulicella tundricola]